MKYLFITWLFFLFSSCSNTTTEINQITLDQLEKRLNTAINNEEERFQRASYEYRDLLSDFTKSKFRVLEVGLDSISKARNWNQSEFLKINQQLSKNQKEDLATLRQFQEKMIEWETSIIKVYKDMLWSHHQIFDLKQDFIEKYILEKEVSYNDYKTHTFVHLTEEEPLQLALRMIHLSNYDRLKQLENNFMELVGGIRSSCFENMYFPVVIPTSNRVDKGEMVRVGLGQYTTAMDPSQTKIIINKDTLNLRNDGTVLYKIKPSRTGKQTLLLQPLVKNPLTGEYLDLPRSVYDYYETKAK
jgi:hypothetical protein